MPSVLTVASEVLSHVRKVKAGARRSVGSEVATLTVTDTADRLAALAAAAGDVRDAGKVAQLTTVELVDGDAASVEVVLVGSEPGSGPTPSRHG
jgi:valyl-tRNA synthetase